MSDTYNTDGWGIGVTESAGGDFFKWGDAQQGMDAVLEIVDVGDIEVSPFPKTDDDKNPIYAKDADGRVLLDDQGNPRKVYGKQVSITFIVLSPVDYEGNRDEVIGERVRTWYNYPDKSLKKPREGKKPAALYVLLKAIHGPAVDEEGFRIYKDTFLGGKIKATIEVGPEKGEDKIRYPKVTNPRRAGQVAGADRDAALVKWIEFQDRVANAATTITDNDVPF